MNLEPTGRGPFVKGTRSLVLDLASAFTPLTAPASNLQFHIHHVPPSQGLVSDLELCFCAFHLCRESCGLPSTCLQPRLFYLSLVHGVLGSSLTWSSLGLHMHTLHHNGAPTFLGAGRAVQCLICQRNHSDHPYASWPPLESRSPNPFHWQRTPLCESLA